MCGGEIYLDKFFVFMWCIVFFYFIMGSLKVVMFLFNVIVSFVILGLIYKLLLRFVNEKVVMLSMFVFLLSF